MRDEGGVRGEGGRFGAMGLRGASIVAWRVRVSSWACVRGAEGPWASGFAGEGMRLGRGGIAGVGRRGYETATTEGSAANAALREAALRSRPAWQKAEEVIATRPYLAFALGLAGLIPFMALSPLGAPFLPDPLPREPRTVMALQNTYGGAILSFLGGVHWGGALARMEHPRMVVLEAVASGKWNGRPPVPPMPRLLGLQLACSVIPSLVAWPALALPQEPLSSLGLAGGLVAMMAFDAKVGGVHAPLGFPRWYHAGLRPLLTAVAVPSLLLTAIYRGSEDLQAKGREWGDKDGFTALIARAIGRAAGGREPPADAPEHAPQAQADADAHTDADAAPQADVASSALGAVGAQGTIPSDSARDVALQESAEEAADADADADAEVEGPPPPRVPFDWTAVDATPPASAPASSSHADT